MITTAMKWGSALSQRPRLEDALKDCAQQLNLSARPDLAVVFVTAHYGKEYKFVSKLVDRLIKARHVFGCSAAGVIGASKETEGQAAVTVMAGVLPGVDISGFHVEAEELPDMDAAPKAWAEKVNIADRSTKPNFILLADPFSFNPENLTYGLDFAFPSSVKIGGLASGAMQPGQNALFLEGITHTSGAIGLTLTGNLTIDPVVAQGCRPVGKQFKITGCDQNLLTELDGRPVLEALEELLEALPAHDQSLARHSLFIGIINSAFKEGSPRDFLIRNLVGLDPDKGILAVGAMIRLGQTVQFHLRDKQAAAGELDRMLREYAQSRVSSNPAGALLFSCLGRGQHLYGVSNHDTDAFIKTVGKIPVSGFFCNGEIGPIDGSTYLHGYTSCFGIVRPRDTN